MNGEGEGIGGGDLAELAARAAKADAGEVAAGPVTDCGTAPLSPEDRARQDDISKTSGELAAFLLMGSGVLAPLLPNVARLYDRSTCEKIGRDLAPVMVKYGWHVGPAKYAEECTALACIVPLSMATYAAAQVDMAQLRALAEKAKAAKAKPVNAEGTTAGDAGAGDVGP